MARPALLLALPVLLAACAPVPPAPLPDAAAPASDACKASRYQGLVGQDIRVLNISAMPQQVRVIGPDMAVTSDYRPDRLNIEHDARGVITGISCF
ncbi:MAG: I78 family peptidase inhibitor [Paracoccus sp. (in: a-proteobacteria)]|nr:I78 family peptidase inhibitor [Paracoccus sp. (in: a-proteobacteria)]